MQARVSGCSRVYRYAGARVRRFSRLREATHRFLAATYHAGVTHQAAHLRRAASQILSSSSDLLASAAGSAGPAAASILSSASDMASSAGVLGVGRWVRAESWQSVAHVTPDACVLVDLRDLHGVAGFDPGARIGRGRS